MKKKSNKRNIHLLILAFLAGLFIGINFTFLATASEPAHTYLDYFHRVYQIIQTEYVEVPPTRDIFFGAIEGMIKSLDDPFSRFLDEKSFNELREMTTGKFVGVGIEITERDGEVVVITPINDSPAMKAGISARDVIVKVNNIRIKGKKLNNIIKMIKGLPGSTVRLHVRRAGYDEYLEFDIEREPIKIKSVEFAKIKNTDKGYLKIKSFGSDTSSDVEKALDFFNSNNINSLILDLRYNPGGLLTAAISVSDLFLDKDLTIVSTKGRHDKKHARIFKSEHDPVYNGEIMVLVNRGSASASEILSGAIRDNKRGKLLGEKTFGKGSVQKSFTLNKNIGVAITIAKYYTPSGELIHKKGIKPDYTVPFAEFSEADKKSLAKIQKKKILHSFITRGMKYTDETKARFHELLKKHGIQLTETAEHFILKKTLYRYKKKPVYDLEFDTQLNSAIKIMEKE